MSRIAFNTMPRMSLRFGYFFTSALYLSRRNMRKKFGRRWSSLAARLPQVGHPPVSPALEFLAHDAPQGVRHVASSPVGSSFSMRVISAARSVNAVRSSAGSRTVRRTPIRSSHLAIAR